MQFVLLQKKLEKHHIKYDIIEYGEKHGTFSVIFEICTNEPQYG